VHRSYCTPLFEVMPRQSPGLAPGQGMPLECRLTRLMKEYAA
jgi:hypothetical protein